jgi:hypothetical protein
VHNWRTTKKFTSVTNVRRFYAVSKTFLHSHYIFQPLGSNDSRKGITLNSALWGANGDTHRPKSFYTVRLKVSNLCYHIQVVCCDPAQAFQSITQSKPLKTLRGRLVK